MHSGDSARYVGWAGGGGRQGADRLHGLKMKQARFQSSHRPRLSPHSRSCSRRRMEQRHNDPRTMSLFGPAGGQRAQARPAVPVFTPTQELGMFLTIFRSESLDMQRITSLLEPRGRFTMPGRMFGLCVLQHNRPERNPAAAASPAVRSRSDGDRCPLKTRDRASRVERRIADGKTDSRCEDGSNCGKQRHALGSGRG